MLNLNFLSTTFCYDTIFTSFVCMHKKSKHLIIKIEVHTNIERLKIPKKSGMCAVISAAVVGHQSPDIISCSSPTRAPGWSRAGRGLIVLRWF